MVWILHYPKKFCHKNHDIVDQKIEKSEQTGKCNQSEYKDVYAALGETKIKCSVLLETPSIQQIAFNC